MRTPNTSCLLCGKPLYRRPSEAAKSRYAACMAHRAEAQKVAGITDAQQRPDLARDEQREQTIGGDISIRRNPSKRRRNRKGVQCPNPGFAAYAAQNARRTLNVRWKGGSSRLNTSIRQMTENRRWMNAVKARDGAVAFAAALRSDLKVIISGHSPRWSKTRNQGRDDARSTPMSFGNFNNGDDAL